MYGSDADERRLIRQSEQLDNDLRKRGLVLDDPELGAYIERIGRRLMPASLPEEPTFRFIVLRDPTMNAFATADGGIYIHQGLLARIDDEAQLAMLLGHEIYHTIQRHQINFLRDAKRKIVLAKVASTALAPIGYGLAGGGAGALVEALLGLGFSAVVTGYGRDNEREADMRGFEAIVAAGYPPEEGIELFDTLTEFDDPGALENFFYGSHPQNRERLEDLRSAIETLPVSTERGVQRREHEPASEDSSTYLERTRDLRIDNIRLRLRRRHFQFALDEIARVEQLHGEDAGLQLLAGEAHRMMAEDPEGAAREAALRERRFTVDAREIEGMAARAPEHRAAAEAAYVRALELDPDLHRAHRGLGQLAYAGSDYERAREELELYLARAQRPYDRRFIERLLEKIDEEIRDQ